MWSIPLIDTACVVSVDSSPSEVLEGLVVEENYGDVIENHC
jgi:hypothetical protein